MKLDAVLISDIMRAGALASGIEMRLSRLMKYKT